MRRNAPNGEVPRPLRSFVSSWKTPWETPRLKAILSGEMETAKTQILQESGALTPGARSCALPRPTFLRQKDFLRQPKREDDGREGVISGRLARKATGVSPSGFARIGVFAGKGGLSISPDTIAQA